MRIFLCFSLAILSAFLPTMSAAKPVPVEYFAQLPAIKDAALSPDGKSLAAIVERNGSYVVATFDLTSEGLGNPHAFDAGNNARYNWVRWANNDKLLIRISLSEDIKKFRGVVESNWLYVADKELTQVNPLLDAQFVNGGVYLDYANIAGFIDDDPNHILMVLQSDTRTKKSKLYDTVGSETSNLPYSVFKVNVNNRSMKRIRKGSRDIFRWSTDRQGRLRMGLGYERKGKNVSRLSTNIKVKNVATNKWETEKDHPILAGDVYIYGFDADPNVLYIGRYAERDTRGLYTYNLGTKSLSSAIYHNDDHDIGGIMVSADRKRVVGYYYSDEEGKSIYFDDIAKARNAQLDKKFPEFAVTTYDETTDGEWAVLRVSAPDYLPEMILYSYKSNKAITLSKLYPKLRDIDIGPVKTVKYTARDGAKVPAYVTLPPAFFEGAKLENLPFIIYPHGGPESRNYGGFDYRAQMLASRGYGVLQMNFRGSSGYGKVFKDAGRKNWQVMQNDVVDGVNWLIEKGYADKDRICITGGSYGGYAAVISAINNPNMYACVASFAGVMDIPRLVDDAVEDGDRNIINYSIVSGFENRAEMRRQSPARRTEELKPPLLLAHGERDLVVDYKHQYKVMHGALKKSSAKVTYLSFPLGDHYLSRGEDRLAYHKALGQFLLENLGESAVAP
jgi:dipeptidyl aminopeptidase/acylaminoacyl peptidase